MPQYDVYERQGGPGYLLDCQTDLLTNLTHRLTVPLLPVDLAPAAVRRLNPEFVVDGERVRMMTQFAAAVPREELRRPIASLDQHYDALAAAIDLLFFGI